MPRLQAAPFLLVVTILVELAPGQGSPGSPGQSAPAAQSRPVPPGKRTIAYPLNPPAPPPETKVETATRTERRVFDTPQAVEVISSDTVRNQRQSRTVPDALRESPGVTVQKTAHGQGSPKIRAQTGFNTLFLLDGIRLNSSIWRSGNVEYWNTVDPYSFERMELLRGPSSVLWGSDAVSGTCQAFVQTRRGFEPGLHVEGGLMFRYASAENSYTERLETAGNSDGVGWSGGFSYKDFHQLTGGADTGHLPYTGYHELDGNIKFSFQLHGKDRLDVGYLHVEQWGAPRTHTTIFAKSFRGTVVGTDFLREFDQQRDLAYVQFHGEERAAWYDRLTLSVSVMVHEEDEARIPSNSRKNQQGTDLVTLGLFLQVEKDTDFGRVTFGADWYHDTVNSYSTTFNPDGSLRSVASRGPVADNARYDQVGVYLQDEARLGRDVDLIAGVRASYVEADADKVDIGGTVPFAPVHESWNSVVGSLRILGKPSDEVRLFGGVAQSFRAPNLSDLTRFDVARSGEQEVPAPGLHPEKYVTFETGLKYDDRTARGGLTWYYTVVEDQISRFPTGNTINGLPEVTKGNIGKGYLTGVEAEAGLKLDWLTLTGWEIYGFFDWVDGRIRSATAPGVFVDQHPDALPPASGFAALRWSSADGRTFGEVFSRMAYHQNRYTANDRLDNQRIPPDGLPGYALLGVRGSHELSRHLRASISVENIGDIDYRTMGSGLNEPGTNVIMTLQARL